MADPDPQLHWAVLGVSVGVLLLSFVLRIGEPGKVVLPGLNMPLPETCTYKRALGRDCPGCGLTRCFISAAHGHWREAWRHNPAGLYVFAILVAQIPYRTLQLWRLRRGRPELASSRLTTWLLSSLVVALLAQWLVRTLVG